jgi:DNA repair photolyase
MAFDFNKDPVRLYGIFPQTPFPVEVSIYGYCRMSCSYCFANLNRDAFDREPNPVNSTGAALRKLDREMADEYSPIGFFLRNRYPVCFSNTTDPFQRDEKTYRASETFLAWCKANRVPVYLQTRGNVLMEEFDRYLPLIEPGRVVVYVSLCQMDDRVRRRHEPGAQPIEARWEMVRRLSDAGVPVVMAVNPYVRDWVPDADAYCCKAKEAGARGVWMEALHFTASQADEVRDTYRPELLPIANVQPMYYIGDLKRWYAATEDHGLDYFPTPRWDAYFGHRARHPECADPAWLGGKTFSFAFDFLSLVSGVSAEEGGKRVIFQWADVEAFLVNQGVPNPLLDVDQFWGPYNSKVTADRNSWRAGQKDGTQWASQKCGF